MKICCSQEHYDKVVQYAKSINDKTLENCLERLKQFDPEDENDRELLREDPYAEYPDFPAEYRMKDEAQVEMVYC